MTRTSSLFLLSLTLLLLASTAAAPDTAYARPIACEEDCGGDPPPPPPPPPTPPAPTVSFTVSPSSVQQGNSSRLSWSASNATSCSIDNGVGGVSASSGYFDVTPSSSTSYTISCSGSGGSVSASQTVTVTAVPPQPVNATCAVSGELVSIGDTVTWTGSGSGSASNSTYSWDYIGFSRSKTCTGSNYPGGETDPPLQNDCPGAPGVTPSNSSCSASNVGQNCRVNRSDCQNADADGYHVAYGNVSKYQCTAHPGGAVTYSYSWSGTDGLSGSSATVSKAYGYAGTKSGTVTVSSGSGTAQATCSTRVAADPTASLSASPSSIFAGKSSTLSWSSSGTTGCSIDNGIGNVAASGSRAVTPGATTTYTLTCYGETKSATAQATVSVSKVTPPTGLSYACSASGTSVTLTWNPVSGSDNYYVRLYDPSNGSYPSYTDGYTQTSITYPIASGKSYSWWVHSNIGAADYNSAHYSDPTYGATISCAGQADLTAGSVSPTTASANVAQQYTATVTNLGNGTSGSFPSIFQFDNGTVLAATYWSPSVAPGGSTPIYMTTSLAAGTYTLRACANYNTSYTNITPESNYGNNCGPWTNISVAAAPSPDLTAGSVSPSSATVGVPVSLSAPANNIGNSTSGSFPMLFQIHTGAMARTETPSPFALLTQYLTPRIAHAIMQAGDPPPSNDVLLNSSYVGGLAQGASVGTSASYTFPASGTYGVRACANYNTSWTAITPESNYANNCGPWTNISVAAPAAPTCALSANSPTVPSTLTWSSTGATSCTGGGFSTGGATAGSQSVATAGTYNVSCSGAGGSCTSAPVTLGNGTCTGTPVVDIKANGSDGPVRVKTGNTANITWSATNVPGASPSCTISGPGVSQTVAAGTAPTCAIPNGTATPAITTQSTYTITCAGVLDQVIVNVVPKFNEF